jgi:uncharacterized protein (TIGR03790 family)
LNPRRSYTESNKNAVTSSILTFVGILIIAILLSAGTINMDVIIDEGHKEQLVGDPEGTQNPVRLRTSTRAQPEYTDLVSYNDVLVVRNLNSPLSMQIADYFQTKRNIPPINIVNITTSTSETVSRTVFDNEIRTPIEDHIINNGLLGIINFIVTTKGIPLRISEVDTSDDGVYAWDRACVDSDLALILGPYKNAIGDAYWINNPIFNPAEFQEFSFATNGFFLVTRFTGYTWEEIKPLIDKVEDAVGTKGTFYLDVDPGRDDGGGYQEGNDWMRAANATLTANGFDVVLDETTLFMTNNVSAIGYTSWGSNDGNYPKNSLVNIGFENDADTDSVPDSWYFVNNTGSCSMNATEVRSGSWSVRVERAFPDIDSTYVAQNYTVKPDTRYYATGFANLSGVSTDMGAHLQILAYDSGDNIIAYFNGTTKTGTTGSWEALGQTRYEPISGISKISFGVVLSKSSGIVFFDDVRLYEIKPHNQWLPGSLAETYVSTGGRSFNYGTGYGQSLVADIIRDGVTGIKGYVYEPFLSAIAHPDLLFDAYTQGFNLAESYYQASAYLSWMDVVVGDPKLAPYNPRILSDLALISGNITFSDPTPQSGSVIDIFANIENLGPTNASSVEIEFYVGDPQTGTLIGTETINVEGWETNLTSISWDTTGYVDGHNITVVVDGPDFIFESNETNNNASTSIIINTGFPIADAGLDDVITEDFVKSFDGSGSTDNSSIENYTWDFGDGEFAYSMNPGHSYEDSGIYFVTLNVTNKYGLWDIDSIEITVNNVGPTAEAGSNISDLEGVEINFDGSGSTDTPSDLSTLNYTWDFGDGNTGYGLSPSHNYSDDGVYTISLEVRDDDGAIGSDSLTVTLDNVAPQITPVPDQTIMEDVLFVMDIVVYDVIDDTLTFSDNTPLFEINSTTGRIEIIAENQDVGDHLVRITVADDDGGESYIDIQISVENTNDPPQIISQPITEASEEVLYEYYVLAMDDDLNISAGEEIFYSLDDAPPGMTIDSSGRVSWVPGDTHVLQSFTVIVNVSDGQEFDIQTYQVFVNNVNDPPQIISTSITSAAEDSEYYYDVEAEDEDPGDVLSYSLEDAPEGLIINENTGEISWMPQNHDVGTHNIIINVTDLAGAFGLQEFKLTVSNTNDAPLLSPIGDQNSLEDQVFVLQVIASDEDLGDSLRYYDDSDLFQIDRNTGKIAFTPTNDDVGDHSIIIMVKDESDSMDSELFTLTVKNINDPPILTFTSVVSIDEDEYFTMTVEAEDEDVGDPLTFSDDTEIFDIDSQTGEISFTPVNEDVGSHSINISVRDSYGAVTYRTLFLTIRNVNDPPHIDNANIPGLLEIIDLEPGETFELTINVDDVDLDESLIFSDNTDLFDIDPESGEIIYLAKSKDAGSHEVKITVRDSEGETDEIYLNFRIKDQKEEGTDLIWFILPIVIAMVVVLVLFILLKGKKQNPQENVVFSEQQPIIIPQNQQNYPPPPPPPQ